MFSDPTALNFSSEERIDARTMPSFVTTTTLQKDVILLVDITDFNSKWLEYTQRVGFFLLILFQIKPYELGFCPNSRRRFFKLEGRD